MRFVITILCLALSGQLMAKVPDVKELRQLYCQARENKSNADKFLKAIEGVEDSQDPLILSYKGLALLFQADFSYNPYNKFSFFNRGKALMEQAIKKDPANAEIRFLRFCVQTNVPFFLNYNSKINEDKLLILNAWSSITDEVLKQLIKDSLIKSGYCNAEEKKKLI